jgi:zinc protease
MSVFKKSLMTLAIATLVIAPARARPTDAPDAAAARPWLYRESDYPVDTRWQFGEFAHGLRWAFRHNETPKGQVSIRIRVATGSLMERPQQCGYAHFIEHMAFRKTKAIPVGEVKRIFERLGAEFGNLFPVSTYGTDFRL